jgi:uncharacterized protein (TIGR00730 family)
MTKQKHSPEQSPTKRRSPARQMASPTYRLPARDEEFILGDSTRGVRFLLEYQKAEEVLREAGVASTIVVFGSARVAESDAGRKGAWYAGAREFARLASEHGGAKDQNGDGLRHNVIATGGGPGIMEAANRGADDASAPNVGYNIKLPHEQEPNAYSTPDLTLQFHYFAMRKMHFAIRAAALVVFPGGFGTLDELFEILTLRQTGKMTTCCVVLYDRAFWEGLVNFEQLIELGMIKAADLSLFHFADTPADAWDIIAKHQGIS